jgi:hypothetical protein
MNTYGYELGPWIDLRTEQCGVRKSKWSDRILTAWATVSFLRKTQVQGVMPVNLEQAEMKYILNCLVPSITAFNQICCVCVCVCVKVICYCLTNYLKFST